jgi:predicted nucleic acid-binding Zn ribbon protein
MTDPLDSVFPIKDLLGDAGRGLGLPSAVETGQVWSRWSEIVGPAVAAHAEPSSLKTGVLRVRADSPAWATEIGYLKDEIKAAVNRLVGCELVGEVKVWTGPGAIRAASRSPGAGHGSPPDKGAEGLADAVPQDPKTAVDRAHEAWTRRHLREV